MTILSIDTSNQALSIALMQDETLLAELTTNINQDHSSRLMPAITDLLDRVAIKATDLEAIAVAAGPGSYTGTRIGITTAKTLAWALDIPIYPISSLAALSMNGRLFNGLICPFFDARRKNVFTGLYEWKDGLLTEVVAQQNISMETWLTSLKAYEKDILFLSPHLHVFSDMITENLADQAIIPEGNMHQPKAANLIVLSKQDDPVPAHEVLPNYLRITEAEANWLKTQKDDEHRGSNGN